MTVTLINSKSRVAPLELLSISRLELSAAHLLAKLAKHYLRMTKIGISSPHLWSDFTDVLQWLKSHPSRWKPFVANRCANIHNDVPDAIWHHVRTKDNPADLVSPGCTIGDLNENTIWWHGRKWLKEFHGPWTSVSDILLLAKNLRK